MSTLHGVFFFFFLFIFFTFFSPLPLNFHIIYSVHLIRPACQPSVGADLNIARLESGLNRKGFNVIKNVCWEDSVDVMMMTSLGEKLSICSTGKTPPPPSRFSPSLFPTHLETPSPSPLYTSRILWVQLLRLVEENACRTRTIPTSVALFTLKNICQ